MIKNPLLPYRDHVRAIVLLGLPLIGGQLAQYAIHLTDTIMLGRYGVPELAASVLATSMFILFFIVGMGFAWAVMPLAAAATGEGDAVGARRITRMGLWLSVLFSLACAPVFWWSGAILMAFGQAQDLAMDAQLYMRIAGLGLAPGLIVKVLTSYLAALERTAVVLWVAIAAALANVVINYALIFGNWGAPELGLAGAAIASVFVEVIALVGCVIYVQRVLPEAGLFLRLWRPDWDVFANVFRLGVPIGLTNLSEVGLFSAAAIFVGWLGTATLAAHGIALQIATMTFMIHLGLSNAATVRAGAAYGRRDAGNLVRGAIAVLGVSIGVALVSVAVLLSFPEPLIGLFLGPDAEARSDIIEVGLGLLVMAALFQLVDGAQVVVLGLLRGVQDTTVPMIMAAISYWGVGLPAGWWFGFGLNWGGSGVWFGLVLGLAVAAALMTARFWWVSVPRLRRRAQRTA